MPYNAAISFHGNLLKGGKVDNKVVRQSLEKARQYAETLVKATTPVRSGTAKAGWSVRVSGGGLLWRNPVPYSGYLEHGTRHMRGRHMMANSALATQKYFIKQLGSSLGAKVAKNVIMSTPTYENTRTFG